MLVACAWATRASAPSSAHRRIHGARRPNRDRVRSDSCPNTGLPIVARTAPVVLAVDKADVSFVPVIWATWMGSRKPPTPSHSR